MFKDDLRAWSIEDYYLLIFVVLVIIGAWAYFVKSFCRLLQRKYSNLKATLLTIPFLLLTLIGGIVIVVLLLSTTVSNQQTPSVIKVASHKLINSELKIGVSGEEVRILQSALAKDKNIYPSGVISSYYGNLTQEAVTNFQIKYSINQSGMLDEETTNKFNEVYGNQTRSYYLNLYPTNVPVEIKQVNITNIDPIIDCVSSYPNCNGSSIKAPQSQCSKITCCQVGSSWSVFATVEKCKEAQNNTQQQTAPQNTVVNQGYTAPQNTVKTQGNNVYCWDNANGYGYYTSSGDQCNINNLKSSAYKTCMDTQGMISNTCSSACNNTLDHDNGVCAWAYTGSNPGIEQSTDKYGECLNGQDGTGENYAACLKKCTEQHAEIIKQCVN